MGTDKIFYYYGKLGNFFKLFNIILQLRWWLKTIPLYFLNLNKNIYKIPLELLFKSCCLNSYSYLELVQCYQAGIKDWVDLRKVIPDNLAIYINCKRIAKIKNNKKVRNEINLIQKKSYLYQITDEKFSTPYFVENLKDSFQINCPNWFFLSLKDQGVIAKPNNGFSAIDVVYLKLESNHLKINKLFKDDRNISIFMDDEISFKQIKELLRNYKIFDNQNKNIIFQPYIKNCNYFNSTFPSIVIRVITRRVKNKLSIIESWAELPLDEGRILYLKEGGFSLPLVFNYHNYANAKKINKLIKNFSEVEKQYFMKCQDASLIMHKKFHLIDYIAWDWIPTDANPKLLEGNHNFGLFIPSLFGELCKKKYNKQNFKYNEIL